MLVQATTVINSSDTEILTSTLGLPELLNESDEEGLPELLNESDEEGLPELLNESDEEGLPELLNESDEEGLPELLNESDEDQQYSNQPFNTTLYPCIPKKLYRIHSTGHSVVAVDNFEDIRTYRGIAKCLVLPPQDLTNPILSYMVGYELMYPLCHTCSINGQTICNHNDDERSLFGEWLTAELIEAIKVGYKVIKIYEVHHFESSPDKLFREYIDTFLKIKQESRGCPEWVTSTSVEEGLDDNDTMSNEVKYFDVHKMYPYTCYEPKQERSDRTDEKNPGLHALAKLFLNSFFGKFSRGNNIA
ncbi:uncharacterized protein LOC118423664 isoform X2 [Branchiostoma floridae]|uniref:DNA-directed DNA polymerase n=1 Tax=Branchiostoma floridae TaxID=7739 RepID=A0A9J7LRN4_BRAFL|nr:uncharacterized protein LOC118423664 isoform X2 [Branchiostoma floridae]